MALVQTVVFVTILLLLARPQPANAQWGTYFVPRKPVFTTYSSWLVTLTVDLKPYADHIDTLKDEITQFQRSCAQLMAEYNSRPNQTDIPQQSKILWTDVMSLLSQETDQFFRDYSNIQNSFTEIQSLIVQTDSAKRHERALLPFIGSAMSFLFGTAKSSDLRKLKSAVQNIGQAQDQLVHVVSDSVSLLNQTHEQVKENREVIKKLLDSTTAFKRELESLYRELANIQDEIVFMQVISRVHDIFHVISNALQHTKLSLSHLINQLSHSSQGTLDMGLLRPTQLKAIFRDIRRKLPKEMVLPYFVSNPYSVLGYYKYLHPTILPDKDKIHILIALPLLHESSQFDVFEAIQIPVPALVVPLSATYKLESSYIAVSKDKSRYTFLKEHEVQMCIQSPYCTMHTPIFRAAYYKSCVMALYMKDSKTVSNICTPIVSKTPLIPKLYPLSQGHWAIVSNFSLEITTTCHKRSPRVLKQTFKPGLNILELNPRCSAYSKYFSLPQLREGGTDYRQSIPFKQEISLVTIQLNIWNQSTHLSNTLSLLRNNSNLLPDQSALPLINDLPFTHLYQMLNSSQQHIQTTTASLSTPHISLHLASVGLGLIFAILLLFIIYKLKCHKRLCVLKRNRGPQEKPPNEEPQSIVKLFVTNQQEDSAV